MGSGRLENAIQIEINRQPPQKETDIQPLILAVNKAGENGLDDISSIQYKLPPTGDYKSETPIFSAKPDTFFATELKRVVYDNRVNESWIMMANFTELFLQKKRAKTIEDINEAKQQQIKLIETYIVAKNDLNAAIADRNKKIALEKEKQNQLQVKLSKKLEGAKQPPRLSALAKPARLSNASTVSSSVVNADDLIDRKKIAQDQVVKLSRSAKQSPRPSVLSTSSRSSNGSTTSSSVNVDEYAANGLKKRKLSAIFITTPRLLRQQSQIDSLDENSPLPNLNTRKNSNSGQGSEYGDGIITTLLAASTADENFSQSNHNSRKNSNSDQRPDYTNGVITTLLAASAADENSSPSNRNSRKSSHSDQHSDYANSIINTSVAATSEIAPPPTPTDRVENSYNFQSVSMTPVRLNIDGASREKILDAWVTDTLLTSCFESDVIKHGIRDVIPQFLSDLFVNANESLVLLHKADQRDKQYELIQSALDEFLKSKIKKSERLIASGMKDTLSSLKETYRLQTQNYIKWEQEHTQILFGNNKQEDATKRKSLEQSLKMAKGAFLTFEQDFTNLCLKTFKEMDKLHRSLSKMIPIDKLKNQLKSCLSPEDLANALQQPSSKFHRFINLFRRGGVAIPEVKLPTATQKVSRIVNLGRSSSTPAKL